PELLEDEVAAGREAEGTVGGLGAVVVLLDVEAEADHLARGDRGATDVAVQGAEDAEAAGPGGDEDALEPPDPAAPPVAPLAADGGLADDPPVDLGDPVAEPLRRLQGPLDAQGEHGRVEVPRLGLAGE